MSDSWGPVRQRVERFLSRIDEREADIRAWVFVDRDGARSTADALDRDPSLAAGSPVRGLVVGVKDIIDVEGMPTASGVEASPGPGWVLDPATPARLADADVVAALRRAGAVILGKTVTTAHAYLDPPPTRNPHDQSRTPGGSSSGSAAAVAAEMCDVAIGTQTGGSLVRPASYCGIHVIKPGRGDLSTRGVRELARSLDHVGLMAGSLDLLQAAYKTARHGDQGADSRVEEFTPVRLSALKTPILERMEPEMATAFHAAVQRLRSAGELAIRLHEFEAPASFLAVHDHYFTILSAEAAHAHRHPRAEWPERYPPRIRELCEAGERVSAVDYLAATAARQKCWDDLGPALMHGPILFPAATGPAPAPSTTGDPFFNSPWSYLGCPVIGLPLPVPAGEMPLGLQVIGNYSSLDDGSLFAAARWIDRIIRDSS